MNRIFILTGRTIILDSVTYLPARNEMPHNNSITLTIGIKYTEEIKPNWKALKSPLLEISGIKLKK